MRFLNTCLKHVARQPWIWKEATEIDDNVYTVMDSKRNNRLDKNL
jgi:hypothetical protein